MIVQHRRSPLLRGHGENAGYWAASGCVVLHLLAVQTQAGSGRGADQPAGFAISSVWLRLSLRENWMRNIRRRRHQVVTLPFSLFQLIAFVLKALWRWSKNEGVWILKNGFKNSVKIACAVGVIALLLWYIGTVAEHAVAAIEVAKLWVAALYALLPARGSTTTFLVDSLVAVVEQGQTSVVSWFSPHVWNAWALLLSVHSAYWLSNYPLNTKTVTTVRGSLLALAYVAAYPLVCAGYAAVAVAVTTLGWILHGRSVTALLSEECAHAMIILLVFSGFVVEVGTGSVPVIFGWSVFELLLVVICSSFSASIASALLSLVPSFINNKLEAIERRQRREERQQVGISGQTLRSASELCLRVAKYAGIVGCLAIGCLVAFAFGFAVSDGGFRSIVPPIAVSLAVLDLLLLLLPRLHPSRRLPTITIFALSVLTACCCPSMKRQRLSLSFWDGLTCSLVPDEGPRFLTPQYWLDLSGQFVQSAVVGCALAFLAGVVWYGLSWNPWAKDATPAKKSKPRSRKDAQKHRTSQPAAQPAPARPAAQLGLSADPSTTSRAIILHASAVASGKKDRAEPSMLRRPRVELLPSDLAAQQGKAAVLVTWSLATDGHRVRTTSFLCTMFSRGVETPVFSGSISGCEVHVNPGVAYQFFVQARNDAGLSSPSARVAINVPVLLASHRASKSGGGLQLEGSPEGVGQQAVTLEAGTTHSSNERRRGEAKSRLNLAAQAALDCPSDANLDALRQAIRAAVVTGVNALLLDRARAKLQKAHNAKETRGAMEARLRSSLASRNPQSLKMLITLAEASGVTNTHDGCLLATAMARLVALTAAADLASQHARATAQQQEQVPAR